LKHRWKAGILYLCTAYDDTGVEMLDNMGVAAFKIASTDANNIPRDRIITLSSIDWSES